MKVVINSSVPCAFCGMAKNLLTLRGIDFEEKIVNKHDPEQVEPLFKKSGMRSFPQIFADDRLIGGFTELSALDRKDQLKSLK